VLVAVAPLIAFDDSCNPYWRGDGGAITRTSPVHPVRRNGSTVASLAHGLLGVESGRAYGLTWLAPKARRNGAYGFCVTLIGLSGEASASRCAPISLR
jgi:hypothetical protein